MTDRFNDFVDVFWNIGDLNFEGESILVLQKDIIEFVNKTPGRKLYIVEVKHNTVLLRVLNEKS